MRTYGITGDISGSFTELARKIAVDATYHIENLDDSSLSVETCIKKIREMGHLYQMTSRRFLMVYLYDNLGPHEDEKDYIYTYVDAVTYNIFYPSLEKIDTLTRAEGEAYIDLLCKIAMENNPNSDEEMWEEIMRKVMLTHKDPVENALSREEVFLMAHGLHFDLETTRDFLIRILDDGSFSIKSSNDLIEMFCFSMNGCNSISVAAEMKADYGRYRSEHPVKDSISCEDEKEIYSNDTVNILSEYELVMKALNTYTGSEAPQTIFLNWMKTKTCLDLPSKNAYRIFCNLIHLYVRCKDLKVNVFEPDSNEVTENPYSELLDCLQEDYQISLESIGSIFDSVPYDKENNDILNNNLYLYYLQGEDGKNIGSNLIRSRTMDILEKKAEVKKTDILVWLWFYHLISWYDEGDNGFSEAEVRRMLHQRYHEFLHHARLFLDSCFLDTCFYPPHPLEYSMLLSIWGRQNATEKVENPLSVYNQICAGFLTRRDSFDSKMVVPLIRADYEKGRLDFEGIPAIIYEFLISNIQSLRTVYPSKDCNGKELDGHITDQAKMIKFTFNTDGTIISQFGKELLSVPYPQKKTGNRFAKPSKRHKDYQPFMSDKAKEERCRFIFGIKYAVEDYIYSEKRSYVELKPSYQASFELRLICFKWNNRIDDKFRRREKKGRVHWDGISDYFQGCILEELKIL